MTFDKETPYNNLPLLPTKQDLETRTVLKAAIAANKALALLKKSGEFLPNQSMLVSNLTLIESQNSSEIENIFTTQDELYKEDIAPSKTINPNTKEVKRYREALWYGVNHIKERPMTTNTFIKIVQIIKENQAGIRKTPGTKIGASGHKTIYTPPEGHDLICKLLANLEEYIHSDDDVDQLIKMAVIHYQFEAIHPFSDGNGRAGRIINILYLLQEKLLDVPVLFLSSYIIRNKKAYYNGLDNVTKKGDWESWVLYILKAIEQTSYETINRIDSIKEAMRLYKKEIKSKFSWYSKDLLEVLFEQPYCRIQRLAEEKIAQRKTASLYLKELEKIGLLENVKIGRHSVYINRTLMDILSQEY